MKYFITHRISALMLCGGLIIFGIISCNKLALSLMPRTEYPGISVIIEYPGISPEKIEQLITKPIEKIIKTVEGIETVSSISEEGKSRINIGFSLDSDIRISALKVREKIALIRPSFPQEVQEPVVVRFDPSDRPILIATVEKTGSDQIEIREIVERKIKPVLQRIDGISEINIAGGLLREIHIDVDRGKFESRSLNFNSIGSIIQDNNISLPGGVIHTDNKDYILFTQGRYMSIEDIADTILLQTDQGSAVRLSDIADVTSSYRDPEDIARLNGKERITLYIHKAGDANTLDVCRKAIEILEQNEHVDTTIIYNQGRYIRSAINNVITSSIWGIFIVVIILYLFIRKTHTVFAIGFSIPVSLVIVFSAMYFLKVDLNVMSLSGLALGAGMIVDNGIVITESIYRHKLINEQSIIQSVLSVKNAIISSTLTTIIVFFPIVFGTIETRRTYGDLAFTVSSALIASLLIAVILIPSIIAEYSGKKLPQFSITKVFPYREELKIRITGLLKKVDTLEEKAGSFYRKILDYSFKNSKKILLITLSTASIALLIFLFFIKSEIVDPAGSNEFHVYLEFPTGTTLDHTDKAVKEAERYIKSLKITETVTTKVEKWRGTLTIKYKEEISSDKEQKLLKGTIKKELGKMMAKYRSHVFISEADTASSRELNIHLIGNENKKLRKLARDAAKSIQSIDGMENCVLRFREGRPEYLLTIDTDRAFGAFLSSADITGFFRTALYGPVSTKFITEDREIDVRMRFVGKDRNTIEKILQWGIINSKGNIIPAAEIINLTEQKGPTKIWRQNGRRSVSITAKIGSLTYDEAMEQIDTVLGRINFPEEYSYNFDNSIKRMKENRRSMVAAIAIALLLVYMLLASLFESLILPFLIMATIPLALIGVIITLFLTRSTLNISVYIGLIVLVGIVVNNGIILIHAINSKYRDSVLNLNNLAKSIKDVCFERFRPVMITTVTTVMGMVPMLIKSGEGSNLWRPLSLTVISGLIFSTILTLVVVPVVSKYIFQSLIKET